MWQRNPRVLDPVEIQHIQTAVAAMRGISTPDGRIIKQMQKQFELPREQAEQLLANPSALTTAGPLDRQSEKHRNRKKRELELIDGGKKRKRRKLNENDPRLQEYARGMRLLDDPMFTLCLQDNPEGCAEILRPILEEPTLTVLDVDVQKVIAGAPGEKGIRLDAFALEDRQRLMAIEIQREEKDMPVERQRHIHARIDSSELDAGCSASALPITYLIVIFEKDPFGIGFPVYHIQKRVRETGERYDDGQHTLYVNAMYTADDALGRLMADLRCPDPDSLHNPFLRRALKHFKTTKKGQVKVNQALLALVNDFSGNKIEKLQAQIAQQNEIIAQKDEMIAQRDQTIVQLETELRMKKATPKG